MAGRQAPRVLITRPEEAAGALQQDLEGRGYATLIEPLLTIEQLGPVTGLDDDVQALILTSANAVPALTDRAKERPVFAVGRATAEAAMAAGCRQVIAGDGDAVGLAALIGRRCSPEDGALLHVAGEVVRAAFQKVLADQGFDVRRDVVYRARASDGFSDELLAAWRRREIAAVLLFSPRTADILVRLLTDSDLAGHVDRVSAICVSEAAAAPCRALVWGDIRPAEQPNRDALLRALECSIGIC